MAEAKSPKLLQQQQAPTKVRKPWQSGQYTVYLWEFLYGLLQDPECCSLITWTNKESKEFRINNTHEIATLWGTVKNRPTMNDKKLLRALRYYYKTKILRKVKGHKGVYQFLSIPYETEGCDQEVKISGKTSSSPTLVGSPEHSVTSNCCERLTDHHEGTADYRGKTTACNGERTVDNSKQTEDSLDESIGSRSREESSSEYSMSSDSSTKSLDELQADLLNTDLLDHMTENMDFVFNDDNNLGMY